MIGVPVVVLRGVVWFQPRGFGGYHHAILLKVCVCKGAARALPVELPRYIYSYRPDHEQ